MSYEVQGFYIVWEFQMLKFKLFYCSSGSMNTEYEYEGSNSSVLVEPVGNCGCFSMQFHSKPFSLFTKTKPIFGSLAKYLSSKLQNNNTHIRGFSIFNDLKWNIKIISRRWYCKRMFLTVWPYYIWIQDWLLLHEELGTSFMNVEHDNWPITMFW